MNVPEASEPTASDAGEAKAVVVPAWVTVRAWAGDAEAVKLVSPE